MCSSCGAEMAQSNDCKESMETGDAVKFTGKDNVCLDKDKKLTMDGSSNPEMARLISPTASLASSDRSLARSSDISVDAYSCGRSSEQSHTDRSQNYPNNERYPEGMKIHTHGNEYHGFNMETKGKVKNGNDNIQNLNISDFRDDAHGNVSLQVDEQAEMSPIMKDYMNDDIWLPPDPEDRENDIEGSVANYDDDDEFSDGTKWGKLSLCSPGAEDKQSSKTEEEKSKAMDEVMNGRFKTFVGQLLKSVDVDVSGENGESWIDIVTHLSWEAASFVKPDAVEGRAMDPDGYVKVKCVATGSRKQSEVIRGLVFKKNVANKHMPTKYANPRLLLIRGILGDSVGLSSFNNIQQEENNHKSIVDMIESCHPNLVLVEKSVSGDIQKLIHGKGMTLVYDMKLHRLERIARCTGSRILSVDILMNQVLQQCDSFHFEQYVLEHNVSREIGKRQVKTLLFIEGCPTRLGCTILLKGAHSDVLKRIKCVVRCAVVMAYHLISETAFLLDQRTMFTTIPFNGERCLPIQSNVSELEDTNVESNDASSISDIPITNGFHEGDSENLSLELEGGSPFSYEPYNPVVLSGLSSISASLKNVIGNSFPLFSLTSRVPISKYLGINDIKYDNQTLDSLQASASLEEALESGHSRKSGSDENNSPESERPVSPFSLDEVYPDTKTHSGINKDQNPKKDEIVTILDSESILVLMSSRNVKIGNICAQSHFSHIKFYHNFDVPLGRFLQENLLNQRLLCSTCSETPDSHFYYYAHHDKQLTIQVKRLPIDKRLPGEAEGKLWMWSRCGKCKRENGHLESTKRVLISTAAQGLSFGKFLELSFSNSSILSGPPVCGHSFHKDFLHFFGLGSMVAMLRYSTVPTYSVSMPPITLEFNNSVRAEFLKKEVEKVYTKGLNLFDEVAKFLQKIGCRFEHSILNFRGLIMKFSDIEEMLKLERTQFEANIQNVLMNNESTNLAVYKLLRLNRFLYDIFLESHIWDHRLYSLLSLGSTRKMGNNNAYGETDNKTLKERLPDAAEGHVFKDVPIEESRHQDEGNDSSSIPINSEISISSEDKNPSTSLQVDIPENDTNDLSVSQSNSLASSPSYVGDIKGWYWASFLEIQKEHIVDLQRGHLPKFEPFSSHSTKNIPKAQELINEEGSRMHIPLGSDEYMISDFEDEYSSIIACCLTLLNSVEVLDLNTSEKSFSTANISESSQNLSRVLSAPHYLSSFNLSDSEGIRSALSFEETHFSSLDGLNILDSSVSLASVHPEVHMGVRKSPGKAKYSVQCLYAHQFRDLRSYCCPSELHFIASLVRCRHWDAKGGKSKSFFAKTLDDRFIIKEIKRTEFESFWKFAPDYFKYMKDCFDLGNQTCLAKILGVYQVTIRQNKSGKETKHDLMVMENLSFGRNVCKQYDLKGALHARFSSNNGSGDDVLLDQNFVNDMNTSPLYVRRTSKRYLQRAVWNDTSFLNSINVMDYSLLVGVDTQSHELVCGIIDYLRQYTWDKQLENWVKSSLVVPKNQLPTVISPKEYKKRFRKFISTYFFSVPDHWCLETYSNPCKLCWTEEETNNLDPESPPTE